MTRRAFTLVEVCLAVALGVVIAGIAAAALRAAAQTASAAEHLATQNALIAAGLRASFDELDWWTAYDDPQDPARQRLRVAKDAVVAPGGSRRLGLPFAPFAASWPRGSDTGEDATGFDSDAPWNAADPRSWWRGSMSERIDSDLRQGRYALFSGCTPGIPLAGYGAVDPAHPWLPRQMRGLMDALGYYGMCEYLPANAMYAIYSGDAADGPLTPGSIPYEWVQPGAYLYNGSGNYSDARGLESLSFGSSYALYPPQADPGWSPDDLLRAHRGHVLTATWFSNPTTMAAFIQQTTARMPLVPLCPTAWPAVETSVTRSMMARRFLALCRVRWSDPVSGDSAELAFTGFGTTLRGARRQRGLDGP